MNRKKSAETEENRQTIIMETPDQLYQVFQETYNKVASPNGTPLKPMDPGLNPAGFAPPPPAGYGDFGQQWGAAPHHAPGPGYPGSELDFPQQQHPGNYYGAAPGPNEFGYGMQQQQQQSFQITNPNNLQYNQMPVTTDPSQAMMHPGAIPPPPAYAPSTTSSAQSTSTWSAPQQQQQQQLHPQQQQQQQFKVEPPATPAPPSAPPTPSTNGGGLADFSFNPTSTTTATPSGPDPFDPFSIDPIPQPSSTATVQSTQQPTTTRGRPPGGVASASSGGGSKGRGRGKANNSLKGTQNGGVSKRKRGEDQVDPMVREVKEKERRFSNNARERMR